MRLVPDELEICSPVRTYSDREARGNRRMVYEVRVSEDMAARVRTSMRTFGERFWPGRSKVWEKPARPGLPIALMSSWDRLQPVLGHESGDAVLACGLALIGQDLVRSGRAQHAIARCVMRTDAPQQTLVVDLPRALGARTPSVEPAP